MFLFIALPLFMAGIISLVGKFSRKTLPDLLANLTLAVLLFWAVSTAAGCAHFGEQTLWFGRQTGIILENDGLTSLMLLTIALVGLAVGIYSIDYLKKPDSRGGYYALFLLMIAGMNGLVLATDLFSIYLFLEISALASYGLVAFNLDSEALEGAFKYLMLSAVASGLILFSTAIIFGLTGTLGLSEISRVLAGQPVTVFCLILFLVGFGLKSALVPFHSWLPDAYTAAPATLPALSSGLLIKVSGIYALTRLIFSVFGLPPLLSAVLMALSILSIVVGALLALGQKDIRRMLGYSSISQVGYILLGIGLGTPLGIAGGLLHLFNHALFKSLLFLNSGALERATGTREMDRMAGLGRKMPVTAATSIIGSLSTAGVPPLNGFWSKLLIIIALVQAGRISYAVIAVLASILTLWYFLLLQRRTFFGLPDEKWQAVREAPFAMSLAVIFLAVLCVATGIFFASFLRVWIDPATSALSAGANCFFNRPTF